MSRLSCSILCTPDLEESLLDALLMGFSGKWFTSTPALAHGSAAINLNAAEEVAGRARGVLIHIVLDSGEWQALKNLLTGEFAATSIHYWVTQIADEESCS